MLDIKYVREHADDVRENIKRKFQDKKLPLVDEVIELDKKIRELKTEGDTLRQERNATSDNIGALFREKKVDEANEMKARVVEINEKIGDAMADLFQIINIFLIIFTAVLLYRNKIWKSQKKYLIFYAVIIICFLAVLLIR